MPLTLFQNRRDDPGFTTLAKVVHDGLAGDGARVHRGPHDRHRRAGSTGWLYRGSEREPVATVPSNASQLYAAVRDALGSSDPQAAMPVDPAGVVHVLAVLDAAPHRARVERVVDVITPGRRSDQRP